MNRRLEEREYEDFTPSTGWVRELEYDTLVVYLPGFKKEQLKVQVTTLRNLRVSGERALGNNKWNRFSLEFPIPANYDINEITAKFEGSSLYIKHPKIITAEDPKPQQQQQIEEQKAKEGKATTTQKVPSKTSMEKPKGGEEDARMQKVPSKTSMEKQKSKEEKQEVPPKTSNEKQPTEKATNSADDLSHKEANEKSLEKKKSEDSAIEDEKTSGAAMEMDKPGLEGLSQVGGGGLVTMVKQTRKLLNFAVALLLALAVGIYNCARNAIRLIGKSNN